jgi:hypothetical protein
MHPKHGVHVAYSADEVARCRQYGWIPREEVQPEKPSVFVTEEHPQNIPEPVYRRGPGRPRKETPS